MGRRVISVAVLAFLAGIGGCRVDTTVDVVVAPGGGGDVAVEVQLDEAAAAQLGDEVDELAVDDLVSAGWDVSDPVRGDGGVMFRARKAFRGPDELPAVLAEVSGATGGSDPDRSGWLRDWRLAITDGFASTTYRVNGRVVTAGDLSEFGDAGIAVALDGFTLGRSPDELAAALDAEGSQVTLTVRARVPGGGVSRATIDLTDRQAQTRELSAVATVSSRRARLLLAGSVGLAAVGISVIGFGQWRSRRSGPRSGSRSAGPGRPSNASDIPASQSFE